MPVVSRLLWTWALAVFCATPLAVDAANFMVNDIGSQGDDDASAPGNDDAVCDASVATGGLQCTLRAAIQEANDQTGPHNITFMSSITTITLSTGLDTLTAPAVINGTNSNAATGNRVEINASNLGCFSLAETTTAANANGARGSTIQNFVIRNCGSFGGITLSGHGYTVSGNRIGTNGAGDASDINNDANNGDGISISGTIPPPVGLPDISSFVNNPPAGFAAIAAFVTGLQGALTVIASPTFISSNLISGNMGNGIELTNPMTVNVQINANIIGLNQSTTLALPNGRGGGSAAGVRLGNGVYGSVVGPANIISGQTEPGDDGIDVATGEVLLPNFIMGNLVGLGSTQIIDVGNDDVGIVVDTRPDTTMPGVNPTGFSLFLGPANTISDNRGTNSPDPDTIGGDTGAGILTGTTTSGVRIYGNQIGAFAFPAGGTPIGSLNTGNAGHGIIVNSSGVQIGGSQVFESNLILRNGKHGILLKGSATNGNSIRNNFIGVTDGGLDIFDFANAADGIHVNAAGSLAIGGTGALDDNVIAGNGRHGIALRNGNLTQGWANHLQRNQIYRNTGLAIDLDVTEGAPDPTDATPDQDPNDTFYANWGQNAPVITAINGAVQYTLSSANSRQYRIDAYRDDGSGVTAATAESRTWLMETTIATDATGNFTGSIAAPAGGGFITLTATDITPAADVPGPAAAGPHNNTSELSNAVEQIEYTVGDTSVAEGPTATTATLTFVVTRSSTTGTGSVDVATANGTATTADNDYVALATTTIPFIAGQATANAQVTVNGDATFEPAETVQLNLTNPMNGVITDAQGIGTIMNDDGQPTISISDVTLAEGTGGTSTAFTFAVTLSNPSSQSITVSAQSAMGGATPATAGVDYTVLGATVLTFSPADISENAIVQVTHDVDIELDETFLVNLSGPSGATLADAQGLGTITNDDASAGSLQFTPNPADQTVAENVGTATFTVTRTGGTAGAVSTTVALGGSATLGAGADYTTSTLTLNWADGDATSQTVVVTVNDDVMTEAAETVTLTLGAPTGGATLGMPSLATLTISANDASAGSLQFTPNPADQTVAENVGTATFTVTRTGGVAGAVSTTVALGGSATLGAGADYTTSTLTLNWADGDATSQTVVVTVNDDVMTEAAETVTLTLGAPTGGATLGMPSLATLTISANDASAGTLQFTPNPADQTVAENVGTATFTVTRTGGVAGAVSTTVALGGSATLGAGADYTTSTLILNWADGDATSQTVVVTVNDDVMTEAAETVTLTLGAPTGGATLGMPSLATLTISANDASAGSLQFTPNPADQTVAENVGTATFTVTRTGGVAGAVSTTVALGGSATLGAGADYTTSTLTLNWADGDATSQTVVVTVNDDVMTEAAETVTLTLGAPTGGATLGMPSLATLTISANDASAGSLQFTPNPADQTVAENVGTATFTVTRTGGVAGAVSTTVALGGSATPGAGADYTTSTLTLNWADGDATSQTVVVTVNDDVMTEAAETVTLTLGAPTGGATLGMPSLATLTISANDALPPDLSITKTHVGDFTQGQVGAIYTIVVSNSAAAPTSGTVTVIDTLPAGLTATAIAGTGWTCTLATLTCTRVDVLAVSSSYPAIMLTVNVATNAQGSITNTVSVSGGGDATGANNGATNPTTIVAGGGAAAIQVPTLSRWMLLLLATMMLGIGYAMRRHMA